MYLHPSESSGSESSWGPSICTERDRVTEKQGMPEWDGRRDLTPSSQRGHLPQTINDPLEWETGQRSACQVSMNMSIWDTKTPQGDKEQRTDTSSMEENTSELTGHCLVRAGPGVPGPLKESTGSLAWVSTWRKRALMCLPTGLLCTWSRFSLSILPWWGLSREATSSQLGQNHVRNVALLINLAGVTFPVSFSPTRLGLRGSISPMSFSHNRLPFVLSTDSEAQGTFIFITERGKHPFCLFPLTQTGN